MLIRLVVVMPVRNDDTFAMKMTVTMVNSFVLAGSL